MALIEFVCTESHETDTVVPQAGPNVTLYHAKWAFCQRGGIEKHSWSAIDPTDVEVLKAGHGKLRERLGSAEAAL